MTDRADVYEAREVVHTVRHGRRIFVIDHVPAEVCSVCGDVVFAPETVRRLKPFARRPRRPRGPCRYMTSLPLPSLRRALSRVVLDLLCAVTR